MQSTTTLGAPARPTASPPPDWLTVIPKTPALKEALADFDDSRVDELFEHLSTQEFAAAQDRHEAAKKALDAAIEEAVAESLHPHQVMCLAGADQLDPRSVHFQVLESLRLAWFDTKTGTTKLTQRGRRVLARRREIERERHTGTPQAQDAKRGGNPESGSAPSAPAAARFPQPGLPAELQLTEDELAADGDEQLAGDFAEAVHLVNDDRDETDPTRLAGRAKAARNLADCFRRRLTRIPVDCDGEPCREEQRDAYALFTNVCATLYDFARYAEARANSLPSSERASAGGAA